MARLVICRPEPVADGVTAMESITASTPVWFGVKTVPTGSGLVAMPLAERIGAIAASSAVSAVAIADGVMADALFASVAGLPDSVISAETAVVRGVTFAVAGAPLFVLALATTE
ncbi:hypothetical protein WK23_08480 [Burkholderia vietnamiensis]|nr:hypothetical protein WK23_08480 [Burkholderia vietnamiensis]KVR96627.1 hypothetical protein WK28_09885 [Burkholderia vietnamiensis]